MTSDQPPHPAIITVPAGKLKILLAALDEAADYKRDRAATCADCADQSCTTCHRRLQAAEAYDQIAAQMTRAAHSSRTQQRAPDHAAPVSGSLRPAADPEAGQ
jgi:hypothetical protein